MGHFDDGSDYDSAGERVPGSDYLRGVGRFLAGLLTVLALAAIAGAITLASQEPKRPLNLLTQKAPVARPGDIVVLAGMPAETHSAIKKAFDRGVLDAGGKGNVTVRLEYTQAQMLLYMLATDMNTNFERHGRHQ